MDGAYEPVKPRGPRPNRRNATDIGSTYAQWHDRRRPAYQGTRGFPAERQKLSFVINMLPPAAHHKAVESIPAKALHTAFNKVKHPVNVVKWTPEGRRLLTASTSGEFTLWNGTGFNFETIMQAHDCAIRAMKYTHNDDWLLSADQDGVVKYWQTNFNNVKDIQAHNDPVRDLAIAPTDIKFVTASDDASLKIFDFASGLEETTITGHQWEAKCVDWHPSKGLIASGSKDHQIKLWDPRNGRCLTTLHGHKNTLSMVKFQPTEGNLLASCAREPLARVFDIRMMRDVFLMKGHDKEIASLVWHPIHASLLTTGGADGSLFHYLLTEQNRPEGTAITMSPYDSAIPKEAPAQPIWPRHRVTFAHESSIWSMDWHPLGHILATGSNDKATRFWCRPRAGEETYTNDRWHIGQAAAEAKGTFKKTEAQNEDDEMDAIQDQNYQSKSAFIPGLPGLAAAVPVPVQIPALPDQALAGLPLPPGMDAERLRQMFEQAPPPGMDAARLQQMFAGAPPPMPAQPYLAMPGIPGMPSGLPPAAGYGMPAAVSGDPNAGVRRRGPLPSQQESLQAEMKQGRYTKAR